MTRHSTKRSPAGPPLRPGAPRPLRRMRWPSATPAGMRTWTSRGRRSTPVPRHVGHGSSTTTPAPPQARHGEENEKKPWFSSITPRPPHCEQTFGWVPGLAPLPLQVLHCASLVRCSVVVMPCTASAKSRVNDASRSPPRCGPADAEAPPPRRPRPNICPSTSPRPSAPTLKSNVWPPNPPPPLGLKPPPNGLPPIGPERADLVVLLALGLVAEHVVRRADRLEALLGRGVAGVRVGMAVARQLAVRLGDLLGRGLLGHAEDLVVVLLVPLALRCHRRSLPSPGP